MKDYFVAKSEDLMVCENVGSVQGDFWIDVRVEVVPSGDHANAKTANDNSSTMAV